MAKWPQENRFETGNQSLPPDPARSRSGRGTILENGAWIFNLIFSPHGQVLSRVISMFLKTKLLQTGGLKISAATRRHTSPQETVQAVSRVECIARDRESDLHDS